MALASLLVTHEACAQRVEVVVPSCTPDDARWIDRLVLELVSAAVAGEPGDIVVVRGEAAGAGLVLVIGEPICAASSERVSFRLREGTMRADGYVTAPAADTAARDRALALALAERARLFRARVASLRDTDTTPRDAPVEPDRLPTRWVELGAALQTRVFLSAPTPTLGARVRAELVGLAPLVLGLDAGAELTTAEHSLGRVDAWIATAAIAAGARWTIASGWDLAASARIELGAAGASGSPRTGEGRSVSAPWSSVGVVGAVTGWLTAEVGVRADLRAELVTVGLAIIEERDTVIALEGAAVALELAFLIAP